MFINNIKEQKKKIYKIGLISFIIILILLACYFGYYKYQQSKIKFQSPEGFQVEVNTKDLTIVGKKWLESYTEQYRGKYVPKDQKLMDYSIDDIEIKETNVIQVDFSVVTKKIDERSAYSWNGIVEENKVKVQWVLWFNEETKSDGTITYTVNKLQRPAGYDLEKYQVSGAKESDEYRNEHEAEIPYENKQYTYKIENRILYVSYDKGSSWKKVPIPLETLVAVGDGKPYSNKLQEKSYVISPEKTAFVYGGTRENPLMMIHSEDSGTTWKTSEINKTIDSARVRFCSFPTDTVGYVIVTNGRTMSQEGQVICKTTNGGDTWNEVGNGPSTWLLQSAGFIDENLGFVCYPKVEGAVTNFYRTQDGGKTFEPIKIPVHTEEWNGITLEPFIQPETPYIENGQLFLLVGQGEQGDFKGGTVMAKYKSEDRGVTWSFVELVEPPSKEIG
ncbi:WD40/YVTN/BNR-like repeat-containing protein [Clostridium sp. 'White wine YQ']|uniref:WD40/YVTN/BNR-like repeat-containing protein n=1 Tax=Clostridium sp. 'White wine YQ' TaxID=3027474 RepID=UPI0023659507|nr:sialidase family protein [Clostridium sp. 'White wine YQ']MDD7795533.1 sialidase family protein [Clostridium sp. 'White wine YQ']